MKMKDTWLAMSHKERLELIRYAGIDDGIASAEWERINGDYRWKLSCRHSSFKCGNLPPDVVKPRKESGTELYRSAQPKLDPIVYAKPRPTYTMDSQEQW